MGSERITMKLIHCPCCDEPCGKEYPNTHEDHGYREGKGEEFALPDGQWCCSQFCLDAMKGDFDDAD